MTTLKKAVEIKWVVTKKGVEDDVFQKLTVLRAGHYGKRSVLSFTGPHPSH